MPKPIHGFIPEISREQVLELYKHIKPVKRTNEGYREIIGWHNYDRSPHRFAEEPDGLFEIAFITVPLLGRKVDGLKEYITIKAYSWTGWAHLMLMGMARDEITKRFGVGKEKIENPLSIKKSDHHQSIDWWFARPSGSGRIFCSHFPHKLRLTKNHR